MQILKQEVGETGSGCRGVGPTLEYGRLDNEALYVPWDRLMSFMLTLLLEGNWMF